MTYAPMKTIIVITVQGGLVAEVNATAPVTVFVEDWDCPPDRPLVMDFESEPLTPTQERRVPRRCYSTRIAKPVTSRCLRLFRPALGCGF